VWRTLRHAADKLWRRDGNQPGRVETSLIEQFLYPKLGPGQMWDEVARRVRLKGGEIRTGWAVTSVVTEGSRVRGIVARNPAGRDEFIPGEYVFSTAPVQELIRGFRPEPPQDVRRVAEGLVYRDFIMVGLLVRRLKVAEASGPGLIQDNWIYIQEPDVLLGRLQIFNNWSPYLVADSGKVWLGLEYFCNQGDALWRRSDQDLVALGRSELARIGILDQSDVEDGTVLRMEKTYPAYLGEYRNFHRVREFLDRFPNLFPLGRNGMHRYNNQDHSMLTAMVAVDNIVRGVAGKSNLWEINTEQEYLEQTAPRTRAATAG
jgi:protoporphyrinogen oxidase